MKAFIITFVVLLILGAGINLNKTPGAIRYEPSAGVLTVSVLIQFALAAWGLSLII